MLSITKSLPYGFFETNLRKRRELKLFRRATSDYITLSSLDSLMQFARETSEFDALIIEGVPPSFALMRDLLGNMKFQDFRRDRPDLIATLLRKHIEIHGGSTVRALMVNAKENETPEVIAAIKILMGFDPLFKKPYPRVLCSVADAICRHLTGPISAHDWIDLTRSLGSVEKVLADPQGVYDFYRERPALLDI